MLKFVIPKLALPKLAWPKLKAPWNERNGRFSALKAIVFAGLFAPAAWLLFELMTGMLFPKPVTELIHGTGQWMVRFILLSLLVTPLRRYARWNKLVAIRRMVGVAAFAYGVAHICLYVVDQHYDLAHVAERDRAALLSDDRLRRADRAWPAGGDFDRRDDPSPRRAELEPAA